MIKPYKITQVKDDKDIEMVDNLFSILFSQTQGKEHIYLKFSVAGQWVDAKSVGEKEIVFAENTAENRVRLYTKINGTLRFLSFN